MNVRGPDGPLDARHHRPMPYITSTYELKYSEIEIYHEPFYQNQSSELELMASRLGEAP